MNYDLYFFIDVMEGGANICQEFSTKGLIECHTQVWNVWMLILFIMPLICQGEGGGAFIIYWEFFLDDLHLQIIAIISPKASVENSSTQWAIFTLLILKFMYITMCLYITITIMLWVFSIYLLLSIIPSSFYHNYTI